jgi:hypothetical protein
MRLDITIIAAIWQRDFLFASTLFVRLLKRISFLYDFSLGLYEMRTRVSSSIRVFS